MIVDRRGVNGGPPRVKFPSWDFSSFFPPKNEAGLSREAHSKFLFVFQLRVVTTYVIGVPIMQRALKRAWPGSQVCFFSKLFMEECCVGAQN